MGLASMYNKLQSLGVVAESSDSGGSSVSLGGVSNGAGTSASATVRIRADGDSSETTANISVQGDDGLGATSNATTSASGEESTTSINMTVLLSDEDVAANTDITAQAIGDDAEAVVEANTEASDGDGVLESLSGTGAASGEDPSASVEIASTTDTQDDKVVTEGAVQSKASVVDEEDAEANADASVEVGPDVDIVEQEGGTTEEVVDDVLIVESFKSVEAVRFLPDEAELAEPTFEPAIIADLLSLNDIW